MSYMWAHHPFFSGKRFCGSGGQKMPSLPHTKAWQGAFTEPKIGRWWKQYLRFLDFPPIFLSIFLWMNLPILLLINLLILLPMLRLSCQVKVCTCSIGLSDPDPFPQEKSERDGSGELCTSYMSHHTHIEWSNHVAVFFHWLDILHHFLSSNSSLTNGNRESRHVFTPAGAIKAMSICTLQ